MSAIFVDPEATGAQVIQAYGACYRRVGPSPALPDTFSSDITGEFADCEECGSSSSGSSASSENPAPCYCPEGMPSSFTFEGHFKSPCDPFPGEWLIECDVSLELVQIVPCLWGGFQSICGGMHNLLVYLTLDTEACAWTLTIPSGDGIYIERPVGQTPVGDWGNGVAEPGQNVCFYGIQIS